MSFFINVFAYVLLIGFTVYASYYIRNTIKHPDQSNPLFLQFLPGLFTTLGIFGTFLGIAYALYQFNVNDTEQSINMLLEGMKTAFITSIIGILLSIIFSFWIKKVIHRHGAAIPVPESDESKILKELVKETKANHSAIFYMVQKLEETSRNIVQAGNQSSTGLLEEIRKTNTQLVASSESAAANTRTMVTALDKNHRLMVNKFDEFAQLLANANTDALREAMENLVNDFNDTFRTLITNLVNQNFDELNISIRNLNTWQQSYRGIIENLVNRLDAIGKELDAVIGSIQNSQEATERHLTKVNGTLVGVATTTESLVSSEGKLAQIIEALDEVLVEKNTLVQSFEKATRSMEALKASSEDFENTKARISKWLNDESRIAGTMPLLQESMAKLITTLNALEGLANLDKEFNSKLQTALNTSFGHLDKLIKEYVEAIEKKGVIEINVKNVGGNEV